MGETGLVRKERRVWLTPTFGWHMGSSELSEDLENMCRESKGEEGRAVGLMPGFLFSKPKNRLHKHSRQESKGQAFI